MARLIALVFSFALATLATAQTADKIKLNFPSEGSRKVWIQKDSKMEVVPEGLNSVAKSLELPFSPDHKSHSVYVSDLEKGNVARRALSQILVSGTWDVKPEDYKFQAEMRFRLESDGKRVASASVDAKIGKGFRTSLITETEKGEFILQVVPIGDVGLTVTYRQDGETKRLPMQTFEAKLNSGNASWIVIELPEGTQVLSEELSPSETPSEKPSSEPATDQSSGGYTPLQTLLNFVIGLALVGGIGYGIYRYFIANREKVEATLKQAGLPGAADTGDVTSAAPVTPAVPKPIQPIVLGQEASPSASAPAPSAAGSVVENPRLVGAKGELYLLGEGVQVVGREAPAEIVLTGESSVSRIHATLTNSNGTVAIEDAGSTNGTFVNGAKVSTPVTLRHLDAVQFGSVKFQYEE